MDQQNKVAHYCEVGRGEKMILDFQRFVQIKELKIHRCGHVHRFSPIGMKKETEKTHSCRKGDLTKYCLSGKAEELQALLSLLIQN